MKFLYGDRRLNGVIYRSDGSVGIGYLDDRNDRMVYEFFRAFPGMIGRLDAGKALSAQGTKFSQIEQLLTTCAIVFVDESGEEPAVKVRAGALKAFGDDNLSVELKGENRRTVRRSGTAVFIGHDWPHLDTSAQGMPDRFKHCYRAMTATR